MPLLSTESDLMREVLAKKSALTDSIAELTTKLDHMRQELTDIDGFLRTMRQFGEPVATESCPSPSAVPSQSPARAAPARRESTQEQIIKVVEDMFQTANVVSTRQILTQLETLGVWIGGKNPMSNVAAILSKSPKFSNSRIARGWMLTKQ